MSDQIDVRPLIDFAPLSKSMLVHTNNAVLAQPADHPMLLARQTSPFPTAELRATHTTSASVVTAGFLFYMLTTFELKFDDGPLFFTANIFGLTGAGGSGFGGCGTFNFSRSELAAKTASVELTIAGNMLQAHFWFPGTPVGNVVAFGGGTIPGSVGGGSGVFVP